MAIKSVNPYICITMRPRPQQEVNVNWLFRVKRMVLYLCLC